MRPFIRGLKRRITNSLYDVSFLRNYDTDTTPVSVTSETSKSHGRIGCMRVSVVQKLAPITQNTLAVMI